MKKLLYLILPALLLVITSCGDNVNTEDNSEFKFQKEITLEDGNGNSVNLLIHADSEEVLEDQTSDVLFLKTSTKDFSKSINSNLENQNIEVSTDTDESEKEDVFVLVTSFKLNPEVTGFSVRSKLETPLSGNIELRGTNYHYAYGSTGVNGVEAEYVSQSCDKEYLTAKLSRKKTSASLFWVSMGSGDLDDPGDTWSCYSSTSYYYYKFKIKNKKYCAGSTTYDYNWLY